MKITPGGYEGVSRREEAKEAFDIGKGA